MYLIYAEERGVGIFGTRWVGVACVWGERRSGVEQGSRAAQPHS